MALRLLPVGRRYASQRRSLPYPSWLGFILENRWTAAEAIKQVERAALVSGMHVLDIGCGTGRITIPAAKQVGTDGAVMALDIQRKMLVQVERAARENRLSNVRTVLIGVGQGEFKERNREGGGEVVSH